jgi:hypothetical protein
MRTLRGVWSNSSPTKKQRIGTAKPVAAILKTTRNVSLDLGQARGAGTIHVIIALRLVLMLEGVECRPK